MIPSVRQELVQDASFIIKYPANEHVVMEISDTLETTISRVQRVIRIGSCVFPTLFGLFMALWGIFICMGLDLNGCRAGNFPDLWRVYVPDDNRERFLTDQKILEARQW